MGIISLNLLEKGYDKLQTEFFIGSGRANPRCKPELLCCWPSLNSYLK